MNTFSSPFGSLRLVRYPERARETLQAWDAADTYLLNELFESAEVLDPGRTLVVNDGFGALSLSLIEATKSASLPIQILVDSYLSEQGILHNASKQSIDLERLCLQPTLKWVAIPRQSPLDLVLIKIPKSLAELEEQLHAIRPALHANTKVLAAGMTKSIHSSTLKLFEKIIGPTRTSLAVKKARLIYSDFDELLAIPPNPFPKTYSVDKPGIRVKVVSHGGVFSHASLDMGTELLLDHLEIEAGVGKILDLGCGSGVIGAAVAQKTPDTHVTFVDESHWAIASAKHTVEENFPDQTHRFSFLATDCLQGIEDESQDLVLNNPPFHQRGGRADHISRSMFLGSKRVLCEGGQLWVVGNRHLGYHRSLEKIFGNCHTVASNPKFVLLKAINRAP